MIDFESAACIHAAHIRSTQPPTFSGTNTRDPVSADALTAAAGGGVWGRLCCAESARTIAFALSSLSPACTWPLHAMRTRPPTDIITHFR